jgi:general L-amino acid transport system substrate-binding protein
MMFSRLLLPGCLAFLAVWGASGSSAATLDDVRKAGALHCGVVTDVDDYSEADTHGDLSKFGSDFCRALAAEIFGKSGSLAITSLPDEPSGLAAVRDGKIDVLYGATPNPIVGQSYGVEFGPPILFDGQGFLVAKTSGINHVADLSGRHVCFINASPAERTLYDALEPQLAVKEARFPYSERGEMEAALVGGHCDAITGDISWMANARAGFHAYTARFDVLPETISLDPFAPAIRAGDAQWKALIDWSVWILLQAEEHGISQASAASSEENADIATQRLLGDVPWIARQWNLPDTAFRSAIQAVGNYGEMYDRDVGAASNLQLPRGKNALASHGGLLWALPIEPLQ